MSDEIDEIRSRRMKELQDQAVNTQNAEKIQQEREAAESMERQKQAILRQILTESAKQRLSNIRLVKSQFADAIENQLIQIYQSGRLNSQITEEQLMQMLKQLQGSKRESKIKFKRV